MTLTLEVPEDLGTATCDEPVSVEAVETVVKLPPELTETKQSTGPDPEFGDESETEPLPPPEEVISDGVEEFEESCQRIEHEISDLTIERADLADRAKKIKKRIDCLAEELSDLRKDGPQPIKRRMAAAAAATGRSDNADSAGFAAAPALSNDTWRSASIGHLNLKPNVHEKLIEDGIETIGQLEDRRAEISQGKAKWPKGLGEAKITEIEDAVVAWLTKNRDGAAFNSASLPAAPEATAANWDELTDAQRSVALSTRAGQLNTGEQNSLDSKHPDGDKFWNSGYGASNAGGEISDCAYLPGPEQDDWIRGFLACELTTRWEAEESSEVPDSESAVTCSVDDL
jgi:hypothetical protein